MTDLKSMTAGELKTWLEEAGEKPFRAKQLFLWMHRDMCLCLTCRLP